MRTCFVLLLPLASAQVVAPTADPVLDTVEVDIWPEYDREAALVMYQFRVSPTTSLDAPVPVPIPASVGEPHAVAWRDVQGSLFVADYVRRVEGDRAMILARLGSYEGQLEFYADIGFEDRTRTFQFEWPGGVAVNSLSFRIQQPSGATQLEVVPEPSRREVGRDGLHYAEVDLGPQEGTATPAIEVRYEKDSDRLTRAAAPATSSVPATSPPTSPSSASARNVWLFALGGVLFGAGAAWLVLPFRAGRPGPTVPGGESPSPGAAGKPAPFCHECGTKTRTEATFCMECGTRLVRKPA